MEEYYKILNLTPDATDDEVDNAYNMLKNKYSRERFYEGEAGNEAAKNLTKLETAYREIKENRKSKATADGGFTRDFGDIEQLIKDGQIAAAQEKLDNINERDAEWHYLQSVVFYKKNWINESKKQLEIAMNMEPGNKKYAESYTKLKQKMEFNDEQFRSGNANNGAAYDGNRQMGGTDSNNCMSFCLTWCCIDMLCSMCCR